MIERVYDISEAEIVRVVKNVLNERKVIKLPQSQQAPQPAPMPAEPAPMGPDPMQGQDPSMCGPQMGGPQDGGQEGPFGTNGIPDEPGPDGSEQFDHNFDAGVEADEDSDPKRYIQQLTGKLSQSLNSFNEQNPDAGLCKYVAAMIIKATCKNLEQGDKDELIEKIKQAQSDGMPAEETPEDAGSGMGEGTEGDMGETNEMPPVNERVYSKRQLKEMMIDNTSSERDDIGPKGINTSSPFAGKIFNRKK